MSNSGFRDFVGHHKACQPALGTEQSLSVSRFTSDSIEEKVRIHLVFSIRFHDYIRETEDLGRLSDDNDRRHED